MWETLSRNDIEAVRTQLQSRREEILRRHAEELGGIEREQAEIGLLDQMIDAFNSTARYLRKRRKLPRRLARA